MPPRPDGAAPPPLPLRLLAAFGRFWWEFLVGDTPELFLGIVATLGLVALLAHERVTGPVVTGALPVLVVAMLLLRVHRARSRP